MTHQSKSLFRYVLWLVAAAVFAGCNSDNDILPGRRPTIEFDSPDGVYTVKVGNDVRIDPVIGNGESAEYLWTMNDEVISRTRALVMNCPREGSFYVMLTVVTPAGSTSAEARIDVLEKTPPVIDLSVPDDGIYVLCGA
ncbi:MAG: cell surface protein, partial [Paramuribaculum sp.]|nr:cell surface protein [Paramuribaculum sp.]